MSDQLAPHQIISLALLKRVACAIAVLIKGYATVREALFDKIRDDGFLVFD